MKVLHVSAYERDGGAARAALRIHTAQRALGMDSRLLVVHRREPSSFVIQPMSAGQKLRHQLAHSAATAIASTQRSPSNPVIRSLNMFPSGLGKWINASDADIVNLHWVGSETLSIGEIGALRQPIVWTMHDMWPFCGGEHYDDLDAPGRYKTHYPRSSRSGLASGPDLDAWVWRRKQRAWTGRQFTLISPSHWLANCCRESALMGGQRVEVVPNCVDTNIFRPIEKREARRLFRLDEGKRYLLFGAIHSTEEKRKGFHLLQEALRRSTALHEMGIELVVFGASAAKDTPDLGLPVRYMGYLSDDLSLALLYSAADAFVAPSLQDNLPNTLVESLCCGTPCVAFDVGGMPDLVSSEVFGRLVAFGDVDGLAAALAEVLTFPHDRQMCASLAATRYGQTANAVSYQTIYRETR